MLCTLVFIIFTSQAYRLACIWVRFLELKIMLCLLWFLDLDSGARDDLISKVHLPVMMILAYALLAVNIYTFGVT